MAEKEFAKNQLEKFGWTQGSGLECAYAHNKYYKWIVFVLMGLSFRIIIRS